MTGWHGAYKAKSILRPPPQTYEKPQVKSWQHLQAFRNVEDADCSLPTSMLCMDVHPHGVPSVALYLPYSLFRVDTKHQHVIFWWLLSLKCLLLFVTPAGWQAGACHLLAMDGAAPLPGAAPALPPIGGTTPGDVALLLHAGPGLALHLVG